MATDPGGVAAWAAGWLMTGATAIAKAATAVAAKTFVVERMSVPYINGAEIEAPRRKALSSQPLAATEKPRSSARVGRAGMSSV